MGWLKNDRRPPSAFIYEAILLLLCYFCAHQKTIRDGNKVQNHQDIQRKLYMNSENLYTACIFTLFAKYVIHKYSWKNTKCMQSTTPQIFLLTLYILHNS